MSKQAISKKYLIHVFTNKQLGLNGNPCSIVILDQKISAEEMQAIATQEAQPATAFLNLKKDLHYEVRWFAPDEEIALCGHGAAASIYALSLNLSTEELISLESKEGIVIEGRRAENGCKFTMPAIPHHEASEPPKGLEEALGKQIQSYYKTDNKDLVLLESESAVKDMEPDFDELRQIDIFGYSITAPSKDDQKDFVSRTLVPHVQQLEDHATGSSHSILFPFWSKRMNKNKLTAIQLSERGGYFTAMVEKEKVHFQINCELVN